MYYQYVKALHIIFVVTWFAGLFYIVRLFVYYAEAALLSSPEKEILTKQYQLMQRRLWYGITWPSSLVTLIFGTLLLLEYPSIPLWLWIKVGFVGLLLVYQVCCQLIFNNQQKGISTVTSKQLRIWNEVATVLLVGIIFLVVLKSALSLLWGMLGLVGFTLLLLFAIVIYKKLR